MSLLFASEARDVVVQVVFFGCVLCCRSGYDHVLLLGHLVPLAYEAGHRPKILKRGGKVTSIALRSGIAFRDITKMLAPSTNLRKFGRLFGLLTEIPLGNRNCQAAFLCRQEMCNPPRVSLKKPVAATWATTWPATCGSTWRSCTRQRKNGGKRWLA